MKLIFLTAVLLLETASFAQVTEVPLEYIMTATCGEFVPKAAIFPSLKAYSTNWPEIKVSAIRLYSYSESRANGKLNVSPLTPLTPEGNPYENETNRENESKSKRESEKNLKEELRSTYSDPQFFKEDAQSLHGAVYLEQERKQKVHVCVVTLSYEGKTVSRIRFSPKSNEAALTLAREELGFLPEEQETEEN